MSKNYKQYDTRWAKLGYPKKPWYIKECGCGEVAIANCFVRRYKYRDETPKTIQPYCKQFAAPNGDGTYWSAPPTMLKHYGFTEVKEHQTMNSLWKELAKYNRVVVYLMSNREAGSEDIKWTGSKHFISSTGYKYDKKTGKHLVYLKDSNSASKDKNGWLAYEDVLRGAVFRVWSGKLPEEDIRMIKIMSACKKQAQNMKNFEYGWRKHPTKENTKKEGTCVSFEGVVCQDLGYLPEGGYLWHDENGKITHLTKDMDAIYPKKTTIKKYRSNLKKGDILFVGNKRDVGAGSHVCFFAGYWSKKGDPYVWDQNSAKIVKETEHDENPKSGVHTLDGGKNLFAVVRLKAR